MPTPPAILLLSLALGQDRSVVLTDIPAADPFHAVVAKVLATTTVREPIRFQDAPGEALAALQKTLPAHVLVVVKPERVDVNFVADLLDTLAAIDLDPFVDAGFGVITGRTPEAALQFFARTQEVRSKPALVRPRLLDLLGPNQQDQGTLLVMPGSMMLPPLEELPCQSAIHGRRGIPDDRLKLLDGYGFVHLGGHGIPERVEEGLTAAQARRLDWKHSLVWNGACWTGVTHRSFDFRTGRIESKVSQDPFCLAVLETGAAAYFAATHPDHGMPVYQEMERLFTTGESLGEVIKHSYDALVLARGGKAVRVPRWAAGAASPYTGARGETEWIGTASRVLFGDPRLQPVEALVEEPWTTTVKGSGEGLVVTAKMNNRKLKSSFTDTFAGDLCSKDSPFNDRQLVRVPLPRPLSVAGASITAARAGQKDLQHRVVGFAQETWRGAHWLWLQADFATTAFQTSDLRSRDTEVTWQIQLRTR